ncbi:MAG TPA: DUF177 domain-containing protein [Candidatus Omnitrophota bacterium]|nr:DUF177 domain-containing protein [Candidatus Omnitrophota bacterium]
MRIYIKDIGPDGLELKKSILEKDLGLEKLPGIVLNAPIEIQGFVQKKGDTVVLDLTFKGFFSFECSRCLDEVERIIEKDFSLEYQINRSMLFIDIIEDVRQEVFLSFPEKVLCQDSCRGICPQCGINLNIEKCQCHKNSFQVQE